MKIDLTKAQIITLATQDPSFLEAIVDRAMSVQDLPDINQMAEVFALEHKGNVISAIKALRDWAKGQPDGPLGLAVAKDIIMRARDKFGLKPYWQTA